MRDFDVIVIGCGPAGQKAAIKCAKSGKRTAIIDKRQVVGGQCLHIGTIPSKTLREAIIYLSGYHERKLYGSDYRVKKDITVADLLYRCNAIIRREIEVIHNQLTRNDVAVYSGEATFLDAHTVMMHESVGSVTLTADSFFIAVGSESRDLDGLPFDGLHIMNTDDILSLSFLPRKMMIVGAGVIGLEYASMFSLLDIDIQLVNRWGSVLPFVDRQLVAELSDFMRSMGVEFLHNEEIGEVDVTADRKVAGRLKSGREFDADLLLYAGPRFGATAGLGLENAGVFPGERGLLKVNEHYQTEVPHIYAAGDVIGFPSLASTAIDQGRKAANQLLHLEDIPFYPHFPYGIYTFPEISMVGKSEEDLKKEGRVYETGIGRYKDTARGQIIGDDVGMVKLLFDPVDRTLLGVHAIGTDATSLVHIGQAVLIYGGQIDYFVDTVFNYPTLAECYKIAALNGLNKLGPDLHAIPQRVLT
ncbi:Si-specific NAD(P)(+) transhydrogenase [bacterium]|nr:Si-specific NAD(P)(+) transhydrogenase [bacterium]